MFYEEEDNSLSNITLKDKPQHVISANGSTKTVISRLSSAIKDRLLSRDKFSTKIVLELSKNDDHIKKKVRKVRRTSEYITEIDQDFYSSKSHFNEKYEDNEFTKETIEETIEESISSLYKIPWTFADIEHLLADLLFRGSRQHLEEERELAVRAVFIELNGSQDIEMNIEEDINIDAIKKRGPKPNKMLDAVTVTSKRLGIYRRHLSKWVINYLTTKKFGSPKRKNVPMRIDNTSSIGPEMLLEILEFQQQNTRLGVNIPEVVLSRRVTQHIVSKIGHLMGGRVKRRGKLFTTNADAEEKRLWKLRIFLAKRNNDIIDEKNGLIVLISMDESYIHEKHHADNSLLETDDHGNLINDMNCATRDGNRLIMIGALSTWGHIVSHNEDGEVVRDCVWINGKGDRVQHYGRFKELNNKREFRFKEEKKGKKNKRLNMNNTVSQFKESLIKANLNCYSPSGKLLTKKEMIELLYPSISDPNNEIVLERNIVDNDLQHGIYILINICIYRFLIFFI
jgi:hypothetical protein